MEGSCKTYTGYRESGYLDVWGHSVKLSDKKFRAGKEGRKHFFLQ